MWAIIPLAVSIIGIFGLIGLKRIEIRRGSTFFASWRARLDARVVQLLASLRGEVFNTVKNIASDTVHHLAEQITALALIIVRFTERRLTRFVNMVKGRREVKNGNGTRSTYLRDVTNHRDEVRRINNYHPK